MIGRVSENYRLVIDKIVADTFKIISLCNGIEFKREHTISDEYAILEGWQ